MTACPAGVSGTLVHDRPVRDLMRGQIGQWSETRPVRTKALVVRSESLLLVRQCSKTESRGEN